MESKKIHTEHEPEPRDISHEFSSMQVMEFLAFLRTLHDVHSLSITVDWPGLGHAKRLKAFLEDMNTKSREQKRQATIRATKEEYDTAHNVFASGVKWEKIEKK